MESLCEYLDWDSEFFGYSIARLTPTLLTPETVVKANEWCTENAVDCLYFLATGDDKQTVVLAEENGFHLVDIRITFIVNLKKRPETCFGSSPAIIRHCSAADIPILKAIAGKNHTDTRFYYDQNFGVERCDALYETWIEKSCNGYADAALVAELGGRPVGYISCHLKDGRGQIGLVGVESAAQGKGLGPALVESSLRWFEEQGVQEVAVVTQGRNCPAQRLYQKCGFSTKDMQLWYHKWFHGSSPENNQA